MPDDALALVALEAASRRFQWANASRGGPLTTAAYDPPDRPAEALLRRRVDAQLVEDTMSALRRLELLGDNDVITVAGERRLHQLRTAAAHDSER